MAISKDNKKDGDEREGMDTFWSGPNMGGNPRFFKAGAYSLEIAGEIEGGFQRVVVHDSTNGEELILFRAVTEKVIRMDLRHKALVQTARAYLKKHDDVQAVAYMGPYLTSDSENAVFLLEASLTSSVVQDSALIELKLLGGEFFRSLDIIPELDCAGIIHADEPVDYGKQLQDFSYGILRVTQKTVEDIQPGR